MNQEPNKNSLLQIPEFCPGCLYKFQGVKASIINKEKNKVLVHITCPKCQASVISSISMNNLGVMAVGMLTDLAKEDLNLIENDQGIGVDDVIEMHEIIEKKGSLQF